MFNFIVQAQGIQNLSNSGCMDGDVPTIKCVEVLFGNLLFMSSAFIILILFIMFLVGGYHYLTSFGSEDKIKKARDTMKYAVLGVVLYVSAYLILNIIDIIFLGGNGGLLHFTIPEE
jgi:hypothetical protein